MVININLCKQEIEEILANHLRQTIPALAEVRIGDITNQANGMLEKVALSITLNKEVPKK